MEGIYTEVSKITDSERNKHHQRVLCNEIPRLHNETIKQLAVRIETLVRKAIALNKNDYKKNDRNFHEYSSTTITEISDKKQSIASIFNSRNQYRNLKLQYLNNIHTNTSQIKNNHESDTELAGKITQIINIYEKNPNFKGKPSFKNWCNYCRRYGQSIAECRRKQQDDQNKPQKYIKPKILSIDT